jgi:hypothetical protein
MNARRPPKAPWVIVFGEGDERYQMTDPGQKRTGDARHAVRYKSPESLTMSERYLVAGLADEYCYLVWDCPTTKDACEKLAKLRRAVRELPDPEEEDG